MATLYDPDLHHPDPSTLPPSSGEGGGDGSPQNYTDTFSDPNGNVTPDDPTLAAVYYEDVNPPLNVWHWSVADQLWYQFSG